MCCYHNVLLYRGYFCCLLVKQHWLQTNIYDQSCGVKENYNHTKFQQSTKFCNILWFCFQDMNVEFEGKKKMKTTPHHSAIH